MNLDKISTKTPKAPGALSARYYFESSAECNQFYSQDELAVGEVEWSEQECEDNLALAHGTISVGTNCDRVLDQPISSQNEMQSAN